MATVLVAVAMVAGISALTQSVMAKDLHEGEPITALELAQEIHAAALRLDSQPGAGSPAIRGGDVDILEDLDGAVFSPPIDASLASLPQTGWSQNVSLRSVSLADPSAVAADVGEDTLYEMSVIIKQGAAIKGRYAWWINP